MNLVPKIIVPQLDLRHIIMQIVIQKNRGENNLVIYCPNSP